MGEDLFDGVPAQKIEIAPEAFILPRFAFETAAGLVTQIEKIDKTAPFRHMKLRRGRTMSVALTNCGEAGWVSDSRGYRYEKHDPLSGKEWPEIPPEFIELAEQAARSAGFDGFLPNACLINRYEIGARLSLHQDKDEGDFRYPIVSVSLGLPAKFLFGGPQRSDKVKRMILSHGDVCVWGGASRLCYHGIDPLKPGEHPLTGAVRYNLTFRRTSEISG